MKSALLDEIMHETLTVLYLKHVHEPQRSSLFMCKGHSHDNITSTKTAPVFSPRPAASTHSQAGQWPRTQTEDDFPQGSGEGPTDTEVLGLMPIPVI